MGGLNIGVCEAAKWSVIVHCAQPGYACIFVRYYHRCHKSLLVLSLAGNFGFAGFEVDWEVIGWAVMCWKNHLLGLLTDDWSTFQIWQAAFAVICQSNLKQWRSGEAVVGEEAVL